MKKLLAILMTVAMIVGAFTFGVSAAECTDCIAGSAEKFEHVVGVGGNNHAEDGQGVGIAPENFNDTDSTGTVVLNLTSVASRYAVDIEFGQLNFTYGGSNVWNVNNYRYEFDANAPDPVVKTVVSITNHSDERVAVTIIPVVSTFLNQTSRFSITDIATDAFIIKPTISDHVYTSVLKGVPETANDASNYEAVKDNVEITFEPLNGKTWSEVLTAMEGNIYNDKVILGEIVVTVSKTIPLGISD